MNDKQRWIRDTDEENGWQIVLPDFDSKPHSTQIPDKTKKLELAWSQCPCKPRVDFERQIIVHNSFIDQERVSEALKRIAE